ERALRQTAADCRPPVAVLYFHPWEFDPGQERLPLRGLNRYRTYVGLGRTRGRLTDLLRRHRFARAADVAKELAARPAELPEFWLAVRDTSQERENLSRSCEASRTGP